MCFQDMGGGEILRILRRDTARVPALQPRGWNAAGWKHTRRGCVGVSTRGQPVTGPARETTTTYAMFGDSLYLGSSAKICILRLTYGPEAEEPSFSGRQSV